MKKKLMRRHIALMFFATLFCSCSNQPSDMVVSEFDQVAMDKAILAAKSTLDQFVDAFNEKRGIYFAVKKAFPTEDGSVEYIWVSVTRYQSATFQGKIDNIPAGVEGIVAGDSVSVKRSEVSDWMIIMGKLGYGGYTSRLLEESLPANERSKVLWQPLGTVPKIKVLN